jgi:hypothetical protein
VPALWPADRLPLAATKEGPGPRLNDPWVLPAWPERAPHWPPRPNCAFFLSWTLTGANGRGCSSTWAAHHSRWRWRKTATLPREAERGSWDPISQAKCSADAVRVPDLDGDVVLLRLRHSWEIPQGAHMAAAQLQQKFWPDWKTAAWTRIYSLPRQTSSTPSPTPPATPSHCMILCK